MILAPAPRPVDEIADRYVDDLAALDPVSATFQRLPGHEDRLTDFSPDGFAERDRLTRAALRAAEAATPVDEREQVARDAFLERLSLQCELYDARVLQSQVSVIESGLHEVRGVFDLMSTDDEEAWGQVDARLAAIPATLEGYRRTLAEAADPGAVSARPQLAAVARWVDSSWTGQHDVFAELVAPAPVSPPAREQLGSRHALGAAVDLDLGSLGLDPIRTALARLT